MAVKKCPKCAEAIQAEALVCRFCGHQFSEEERKQTLAASNKKQVIGWAAGGLLLILIVGQCSGDESTMARGDSTAASLSLTEPGRVEEPNSITLDRFTWESSGDTYCNASAKITNTSGVELTFVKLTTQFLKSGELVGSEYAYTDPHTVPAGASVTWDNMYECPGSTTTVDISASSSQGVLRVDDPPAKSKQSAGS